MEAQQTQTPAPQLPGPSENGLKSEVQSLQRLIIGLLIANLFLGGALGLFLLRQLFATNRRAVELSRFVENYRTNAQPQIQILVSNLQAFAKTNPDFNPILAKYGLLQTGAQPQSGTALPAAPQR
ncbi:MAG: hypothetical protein N2379_00335 [Verrucomicrobiae bacterium]|nr:hypothetical protein [Verrucomicrobiae bacterium]